ncbi:MAG: preprotein translocase subunit YajC [Clostridia bacterium]
MNLLILLDESTTGSYDIFLMLAIYAVFFGALYFFFFRPQNKKKKKEADMRKGAEVGDQIVTIGGVSGRIVAIRDESDAVVVETGSDRSRLLIKRWAIGTVETIHDDAE